MSEAELREGVPETLPNMPEQNLIDPMLFLREMKARHQEAFVLMRISGVHPEGMGGEPLINLYTGEPITDDSYENIGFHNVSVALAAGVIAEELSKRGESSSLKADEIQVDEVVANALLDDAAKVFELMREREQRGGLGSGILDTRQLYDVEEDALVHDAAKGHELMRRRAAGEGTPPATVYGESAYDAVEAVLIENGVDPILASKMREAGKETGHNSLSSFVELDEDGMPRLREGDHKRKIVHLADDMTASTVPTEGKQGKTIYLTPLKRMEVQEFRMRYPWMYREGFGFDQDGGVVMITDVKTVSGEVAHAHTYAQWQDWVARQICAEFKATIDPHSLSAPDVWMREFINERVMLKQAKLDKGQFEQKAS